MTKAQRLLAASIVLLLFTFLIYAPVRNHEFVDFDDHPLILDNPSVHVGFGFEGAKLAFTTTHHLNWTPLSTLSHQLDHSLHGLDPAGYLIGNVLLHAAASLLLFLAMARMTGAPYCSGLGHSGRASTCRVQPCRPS